MATRLPNDNDFDVAVTRNEINSIAVTLLQIPMLEVDISYRSLSSAPPPSESIVLRNQLYSTHILQLIAVTAAQNS